MAAINSSSMGTAPSSASFFAAGKTLNGGAAASGANGLYSNYHHGRDILLGTKSSMKTTSKAFKAKMTPE